MSIFVYTATASVVAEHVAGAIYQVEFDIQSAPRKGSVIRNTVRSLSGKTETIKHSSDKNWTIKFAPVTGERLSYLEELLDSILDGQTFTLYVYGREAVPQQVMCVSEAYEFEEFMPVGGELSDMFATSIEVRAA